MIRRSLILTTLVSLFSLNSFSSFSLEIGAGFHIGNLGFTHERTSDQTGFDGSNYPWGLSLYGTQPIADNFILNSGFYMDPILRNTVYTIFTYRERFFSIGVGPFFGPFNSKTSLLKSGISTSVRIELPGVAFLSFRADSSIGGRLTQDGDYIQERSDASIGYYVRNAICSLNLLTRKYTQKTTSGEVIDSTIEYSFKTDIFQKNIPYKVLLTFGYRKTSKTFIENNASVSHTLGSILVNTRIDVELTTFLKFIVDLENSIYTFGQDELLGISNPGPGGYLFNLNAGFSIDVDKLSNRLAGGT